MARRLISKVSGFVHDISTVASLSDEQNNIRLLSDRSLYILQNLSGKEVTFLSRYGEILDGGFYLPVVSGSPEHSEVEDAINLVRRDLNDMSVEELLECICASTSALVEQGALEGQAVPGVSSDGDVSVGEGEQFPTQSAYFDAKCSVSNGIFDTILGMVDWLDDNDVDLIAGLFGGVTTGLLVGVAISGPMGWAWLLTGALISGIGGYLIKLAINFSDLSSALSDTHDECVLGLFNASDADIAQDNFIAAVEGGSPTITSVESGLLGLLLVSDMVNQLFSPREDMATYVSPDPVDCGGAILEVWSFETGFDSWTFADESDPSCSATRSYDSPEEAIENELIVASLPNVSALAANTSPVISYALTPGGSIQVDHSAPSDSPNNHGLNITAVYSDASEEETGFLVFNSPGTKLLTLTQSKTIVSIEVRVGRSTSGSAQGTTSQQDILEVRLIGA